MSSMTTRSFTKKNDRANLNNQGKVESTYSAQLKYSNEHQTRSKEQETQTSKTIIQLAQEDLNRINNPPPPEVPEVDTTNHHFERKSDIFYSTAEMPTISAEPKTKGLSLTRLFLSKQTPENEEMHFQVASSVDQQELAKPPNETTVEEVFKVPQWSRFTIREIRVKSIDAANNLLIQDYKKPSSTGSIPSIDLDEDPVENMRSQMSTSRRGRSLSPQTACNCTQYSADSTSRDSDSMKQRDIFHGLITGIKATDWSVSLKALIEIAERARSFDHQRIFSHMTEINQKLIEFLRSPRSQVCRAACQIAGKFFESVKDTRRPEFDDIVELLLMKTADSNKFIRKDANLALDALIMNISYMHTIRAISQKGPTHKNDLIRISSARLYVCIVGIAGVNVIMSHVGNDATRQRIFENMVVFIRDKNPKAREYGVRLFRLLHENPGFELYLKKFIDKSRITEIKKIMKKV